MGWFSKGGSGSSSSSSAPQGDWYGEQLDGLERPVSRDGEHDARSAQTDEQILDSMEK